jgi:hypothetical protein
VSRPAVHQVLATLGYGDAIGHEVSGPAHQQVVLDARPMARAIGGRRRIHVGFRNA